MTEKIPKIQKIQAVRGMNDILPEAAIHWDLLENVIRSLLESYGYQPIRLPVVEPTPLFQRAIGTATDIVEKEMYSFVDALNGEMLTLRPEGTAGCARAVIENNLTAAGPQRLYYMGPMFRHERPQKGRYRQFNQVGVETFGYAGPDVDAELILLSARLWDDLGLEGIRLEINCLGQPEERAQHRAKLIEYFSAYADKLDEDAGRRLHTNPLRILDSKNPAMQALCAGAPQLIDFLGAESLAHFDGLQAILRNMGRPFTVNPRLVRGLDYYNLTAFEWIDDSGNLGSQSTICGGGRYDGLIEQLGGKSTAACGFALGVERLVALMEAQDLFGVQQMAQVYVVHQGEAATRLAFVVAENLRDNGINAVLHCGGGGFKSQMKKADASGASYAVIIGDDEVSRGEVGLKSLRDTFGDSPHGEQRAVAVDRIAMEIMDMVVDGLE